MNDFDFKSPFQPKDVKLCNYNPQEIEQNRLRDVQERTQQANGRNVEYTLGYHEKTYSDAINVPPTYGQVIKRPASYGDVIHRPTSYGDVSNNNEMEENEVDRVRNVSRPHNNFYENR